MPKIFCIPKQIADTLRQKAVDGEINIAKMYEMTSAERKAMFEKWVDKDTATFLNGGFEKAMVSPQQTALKKWAESTFKGKEKEKVKKDIFDKIENLKDQGVLTPENEDAFLSDLVANQLGVTLTAEESQFLAEKTAELQELAQTESKFGTPTKEYFLKKKEIEDYIKAVAPAPKLRVLTSTIGRGSMLFSLKSPLLNIESNTVQALLTAVDRRLSGIQIGKNGKNLKISSNLIGKNSDFAKSYINFARDIYQSTGYDVTRMRNLADDQMRLGEDATYSAGKGKIRKIGRMYEDIVFKNMLGLPDVIFSAFHFGDSANLFSTKIAKSEGLKGEQLKTRALEIFKDSTRINPKTEEGKTVRDQAIADAEYATYTNKSWASDLALGIRNVLNSVTGDYRFGDQLMPFVKTPANVVKVGLDYSGVGIPVETVYRMGRIIKAIRSGDPIKESVLEGLAGLTRVFVRSGLGITLAYALSSLFEPEDYIGEYPTSAKERELLKLKNATTNSVRIGDKWVSLDYFGALATPMVGMLTAKKYGKDTSSQLFNYYLGVTKQSLKIPGLSISKDLYDQIENAKYNELDKNLLLLEKSLVDYARSRSIPAFINDIAKATDAYERQVEKNNVLEPLVASIPFLRQTLPTKKDMLARDVQTEGWMQIVVGSRVKTYKGSVVVDEITRLAETNNLPSVTNITETSPRFKELKEQVGAEKFREVQNYMGEELNKIWERKINSFIYKRLPDDKKASALNALKDDIAEKTLKKYRYKPKKKQ